MTLSSTTRTVSYSGNGTADEFAVPFPFRDDSHLRVTRTDVGGTDTVLTLGSHYSVDGAGAFEGTGTVTLLDGNLADGYGLTIARVVPFTQLTDLRNQGAFYPETHELALDQLTSMMQQLDQRYPSGAATLEAVEDYVDAVVTSGTTVVPAQWNFTGSGSTTVFALTGATASSTLLYFVSVAGLLKLPTTDYLVDAAAQTITFGSAPALNAAVHVRCLGYAKAYSAASNTAILPTGGTTTRTLAQMAADFGNVKAFGAVGDGVVNDTAAIQACLDAYAGKTVFFPPGTYKVTSMLSVANHTQLIGSGAETTILRPAVGTTCMQWGNRTHARDLQVYHAVANASNVAVQLGRGVVFELEATGYCSMLRVFLIGTGNTGVGILGKVSLENAFFDCRIESWNLGSSQDEYMITKYTLTGTVDLALGSPIVTGHGTAFLTELYPGAKVFPENSGYAVTSTVLSVQSNTQFTMTGNPDPGDEGNGQHMKAQYSDSINSMFHFSGCRIRVNNVGILSASDTSLVGCVVEGNTYAGWKSSGTNQSFTCLLYAANCHFENSSTKTSALTGTVTVTGGSPIVTGSGTAFVTQLFPGAAVYFSVNGYATRGTVLTVDSNTQFTMEANPAAGAVGAAQQVKAQYFNIWMASGNANAHAAVCLANCGLGGPPDGNDIYSDVDMHGSVFMTGGGMAGGVNLYGAVSAYLLGLAVKGGTYTAHGASYINGMTDRVWELGKNLTGAFELNIGQWALFSKPIQVGGTEDVAQRLSKIIKTDVTWNPPSLADGASATTDATVTGAALGNLAIACISSTATPGWGLTANVTDTNKVTLVLTNKTGGTVDLASVTIRVLLFQFVS